jgi:predicted secreted protein
VIQIELEALGTAGYAWHIETLDPEYLEITSKDGVRNSTKGSSVGAPATHMWQFRGIKTGDTEIVMLYYRIWEGKNTAIDEFRLKVKID